MMQSFESQIGALIQQKNYPCIAAVTSFLKKDYQVGHYKDFGDGTAAAQIAADLLKFREEYKRTKSSFLSFFAAFEGQSDFTEEEFEARLWKELSYMSGVEGLKQEWDPNFSENPEEKNFCFSLDGTAFFVVGMHKNSSRKARQFDQPVLVFNVYEQFFDLQKAGKYDAMVHLNRKRETAYQGDPNPMAVAHGNDWEAIQFSGRNNSEEWKCPFHRGLKKDMPTP